MPGLAAYRPHLEGLLRDLAATHGVPGAVCGVLLESDTAVAVTGVANVATGVEVTPDTLFQIGSLTKLYTTTLVLQAHSAGVLALDEPVRAQLQEFSVADPGATLEITPRHLLTHTSGIAGDHLLDTGANADALKLYVATLPGLGQLHAPDETHSFCNTGFGVAGRLIEAIVGGDFDQVLRRRLGRPLGCTASLTLPQHMLLRRVAVGHEQVPGDKPSRQARWTLTRSNGPMGGIVCPAEDLLLFARMHLEGGAGADGAEILPAAAVELMKEPHSETPLPGEEQALGWTRRHWGDALCLGQDGDTFGQRAFLRVLPDRAFATCVLTNSPLGAALARDLLPRLAADLLDLDVAPGPEGAATRASNARPGAAVAAAPTTTAAPGPSATPGPAATPGSAEPEPALDRRPFVGSYTRLHQRVVVAEASDNGLMLTTEPSGVLAALGARRAAAPLRPLDPERGTFTMTDPTTGVDEIVVFDRGRSVARSVYVAGRLHTRAS